MLPAIRKDRNGRPTAYPKCKGVESAFRGSTAYLPVAEMVRSHYLESLTESMKENCHEPYET
jgi:hypothetical protein